MVVLDDIRVYITRLQNRVAQYIATRPIMDLCLSEERRPGMWLFWRLWEQTAPDILGIRAGHTEADMEEETEMEESEGERD